MTYSNIPRKHIRPLLSRYAGATIGLVIYEETDNHEEKGLDDSSSKKQNNDISDNNIDNVSEQIRWIFEDNDNNKVDDENEDYFYDDDDDESFFDDIFMTDEEEEDGPDASLNEDDLMELHDINPEILKTLTNTFSSSALSSSTKTPDISWSAKASTGTDTVEYPIATTNEVDNTAAAVVASAVSLDAVLSSNLSYFYLRDELGLSEDVMWKITNHASSVLGLKAGTVRTKVELLQRLVGFTDSEIRQLITSNPALLQLSAKKNISPTILFWIRQLGIGKDELKTLILGCPSLLKYSRANISGKLSFFQITMGYSLSDCRNLLLKEPSVLTGSVKTGLIPRLDSSIKKLNPNILRMSVDQNLQPKIIFYFMMTLRMDTTDVGKMLVKYPQILNYNLEHHILPIHHYLLSLDFSTHEFSRILQKYPRVISFSLIRIKRQIGYLRFELNLEASAIRRILHQCPQVVSLGRENIERTVQFLLQAVVPGATLIDNNSINNDEDDEGNNDDIGNGNSSGNGSNGMVDTDNPDILSIVQILLTGLPTLLGCSVDNNLEPKVDYLRERLGQEELSGALLRLPPLLGYSLEKRIRPRLEQILEAGIPGKRITVAITLKEDSFHDWLEKQQIKYKPIESSTIEHKEDSTDKNNKNLDAPEDANNRTGKSNSSRVVEEGGKIIHWRR
ncbi:hypothetical protein FRACYDRAFT_247114 [Fragilariopsis cylindrus CCMP1102]|uniref:mTERF-domain-containing protein n=1 Tax=Fragilariopsis cylindrus CCMP1102 TaxID=635003 RepID=A0A1E7EYF7_9STRA|nr:hypothetical protein FRACYDRAFT_247114 [Fragilariopsis cylindrus CCMP1102]|eukprot:OEU10573.1 hypothetical protein FRACYDRAFT_247114 [Fragilariopsis cylindrus CCMP1102]